MDMSVSKIFQTNQPDPRGMPLGGDQQIPPKTQQNVTRR